MDIIGHSLGGVVALDWLARTVELNNQADLGKIHALFIMDSPISGMNAAEVGLFCTTQLSPDVAGIAKCVVSTTAFAMNGLVDSDGLTVIDRVNNANLTTRHAMVATYTCLGCVETWPGIRTTLGGVWHHRVALCDDPWHGCLLTDILTMLDVGLWIVSEVGDSADIENRPRWSTSPDKTWAASWMLGELGYIGRSELVSNTRTGSTLHLEGLTGSVDIAYRSGPPGTIAILDNDTAHPD